MMKEITYPAPAKLSALLDSFNSLMDLEPIQHMLDMLHQILRQHMRWPEDVLRYSKDISRYNKELLRAKAHNMKVALKWDMLRKRSRREKVLADLGGEPALKKWEARLLKAATALLKPKPTRKFKAPDMEALKDGRLDVSIKPKAAIKTDATGAFRLAPIPRTFIDISQAEDDFTISDWERKVLKEIMAEARQLRADIRAKAMETSGPFDESTLTGYWWKDEAANTIYRLAPIPLLPDELRGVGIEDDSKAIIIAPRHEVIAYAAPEKQSTAISVSSVDYCDCETEATVLKTTPTSGDDNKVIKPPP